MSERIRLNQWTSPVFRSGRACDITTASIVDDINILVAQLHTLNTQGQITYAAIKFALDRELPHISRSMLELDPDPLFWINLVTALVDY